jgi:hypothetical protein
MIKGSRTSPEELFPAELHVRAREYRLMAATAITAQVRDALLSVARNLEQRAVDKDAEAR